VPRQQQLTLRPLPCGAEFTNEIFNGGFAFAFAVLSYLDMREKTRDHYEQMHLAAAAAKAA
jgi:hypothetical protein